jgi:hypothetical protein
VRRFINISVSAESEILKEQNVAKDNGKNTGRDP